MADEVVTTGETSQPQSMEDRVASLLFGDEQQPQEEVQAEADAEQTSEAQGDPEADDLDLMDDSETVESAPAPADDLEIVYNGEAIKVPKSEAKDLAQLGMHFKRNNERFEQQWKSVEQYAQAVQQAAQVAPEVAEAQAMVALYQRAIQGVDVNGLAQLARTDPAAYVERQAELQQLQFQYQSAQQMLAQKQQQYQHAQQAQMSQWLTKQDEALQRAIPQWRDPAKRQADEATIRSAMQELGYSDSEIENLRDARGKRLAHYAAQYLALQKAKGERLKRAEQAPAVAKPGAAQTARSSAADRDAQLTRAIKTAKTPAEKARLIQAKLAARI